MGQTVVVLGGSSGIGLATARRARDQGAKVILTARDPDRLHHIGLELGASISAFDLSDTERLTQFFANLPGAVDHVLVSGPDRRTSRSPTSTTMRFGAASKESCLPFRWPLWRRTCCAPMAA
ncbi:SDR family NAD(P)-dependent oxidoreductase [Kribbella sp. CWNU-51]